MFWCFFSWKRTVSTFIEGILCSDIGSLVIEMPMLASYAAPIDKYFYWGQMRHLLVDVIHQSSRRQSANISSNVNNLKKTIIP